MQTHIKVPGAHRLNDDPVAGEVDGVGLGRLYSRVAEDAQFAMSHRILVHRLRSRRAAATHQLLTRLAEHN